jgi:RNA polymerase sigma factor (sigma-70 family)
MNEKRRPDDDVEDALLVERARTGDEAGFEALVEKYSRRVLSYCRRMVRQDPIAEDLAQEVFVKLFYALPRFDATHALTPFLFRIAHNHCVDWLRSRRPPTESLTDEGGEDRAPREFPDARPTPERNALDREIVEAVDKALSAVPETYRSVLVMRHVEDMSYEEISAVLELPLGTVKARIHRGRERLQQALRTLVDS